ncbi:MAG TPA: hypothetical protein VG755_03155 [Nannocystaceae bacterium]|nr:hypothetical protein [Nannocystaceae bacterium]
MARICAASFVVACGDDTRGEGASASASVTASAGDSSSAADSNAQSEAESAPGSSGVDDSSDGGGTKLDVGAMTGVSADDGGTADECTNVDILFVIDDSSSMGDNQQSLVASFPGFVAGIQQNLELAESYHIGVVTSDDYGFNAPGCQGIGDLVWKTGGFDSSAAICGPFASGGNYLDQSEPDLAGKFACAAQVGSQGADDEKMARGMLNALRPDVNAPGSGACNEGFARDDSLLVIVLISDEDDVPEPYMCDPDDPFGSNPCMTTGSTGTPDDWKAELAIYKDNLDTNVVVLALVGLQGDNPCGAVPASKLIGFANRFDDHGYTDDICAASYDEFFAAALPIIDQACEDYVPPEG